MPKKFNVSINLPQLPGHRSWYSRTLEASDFGRAADMAFRKVKEEAAVKGKRLKQVKFTVDLEGTNAE